MAIETIRWEGDHVRMIDQTRLPAEKVEIEVRTVAEMVEAIQSLRIRGAPAIGIAAAMGLVAALVAHRDEEPEAFRERLEECAGRLAAARPTAVNLSWALDRMRAVATEHPDMASAALWERLETEALRILDEDRAMCRKIGEAAQEVIRERAGILTHCNAGGLATSGYGTALACAYVAHERGKRIRVYAGETRPLLQGSRLTAWELMESGVDVTVITDGMTAATMARGAIDLVIVGADRVAANGDTANKIGTYGVAILAKEHGIPFYVAAPRTTFDFSMASGAGIPIEERDPSEVTHGFGSPTAPAGVKVFSPAFDVTPARYITGFFTDAGLLGPPYGETLNVLRSSGASRA
ncbi:MAG TPA: S-methyl-5-thioribose-1-phosphate isomerase [Gemmatimonadota bacterium]|nr:S-methyl-5-thioribose-1-phosphate isomerase [Gemmatimonadota bacterium]